MNIYLYMEVNYGKKSDSIKKIEKRSIPKNQNDLTLTLPS